MSNSKSQISAKQIRARHGVLIDKKFLTGLTEKQAGELAHINRLLDIAEEKHFATIKKTLIAIKAGKMSETP
jgi:hypothetical protein